MYIIDIEILVQNVSTCSYPSASFRMKQVRKSSLYFTRSSNGSIRGAIDMKGKVASVKLFIKHHVVQTYRGSRNTVPPFLTSALDGSEWSVSRQCPFISGETAPDIQWIGGWLGPNVFKLNN
jgi:hypothetical protein